MTSIRPKISVCIPTYNQGAYLAHALESVLTQTFGDFEVIVYDDGSTDNTREIVAGFSDSRIRYFRHAENVGIAENRNSCLAVARGEYIGWLDSDDIYLPEMLATQSATLDRHPNVGLVHSAYHVIDSESRRLADWALPFTNDCIESSKEALGELTLWNYITAPTVLVRRSCHDRAGRYAADIGRSSTDWDMWVRIALHADIAYNATSLAQYRQHDNSISATTSRSGQRLKCDIAVVKGLFSRERAAIPDADALERRAMAALTAKTIIFSGEMFTLGQKTAAFKALLQGLSVNPSFFISSHGLSLMVAIITGNEYANFIQSKKLLGELSVHLAGTKYGDRIRKHAVVDAEWERTFRETGETVARIVPRDAKVAVVDKCDPTLLHFSQRKGWHFPDQKSLPGGYPRDSEIAIDHLESLRRRGAKYLVFPKTAFWWLDHYRGFQLHLDSCYRHVWKDGNCIIYRLA